MILKKASNIKSGWKSIFNILSTAAQDTSKSVIQLGFKNLEKVIKDHFTLITDAFIDLVNCLIKFGSNQLNEEISQKSIEYLELCAKYLIKMDGQKKIWLCLLSGLSKIVYDSRSVIQIQ